MPDEPAFYEGSRPVHEPEATKLDAAAVARCRFPKLTTALVETMAQTAATACAETDGGVAWAEASDGCKEMWRLIAKRVYAALALSVGAKVEGIGKPKGD